MANVLNSEPESTTLNTELETPTLEPAADNEQPSYESTSNPETASATLDADATPTPALQEDAPQPAALTTEPRLPEPASHSAHSEPADDFSAALEA
ncbi:MAG: hypothetical protein ACLGP3_03095, partial [Acidobacteriota bacterium]